MPEPQPKDRIARGGTLLRAPKGTYLLYQGQFVPGFPQYIRYWIPPKGDTKEASA